MSIIIDSVYDFLKQTRRSVLVISHDRELLEHVDVIFELSNVGLTVFGGNWEFYKAESGAERDRLFEGLDQTKRAAKKSKQDRIIKLERQEKRTRDGKKAALRTGVDKAIQGDMKRKAQRTQGRLNVETEKAINSRVADAQRASGSLKVNNIIYAEFPKTFLPSNRLVFEAKEFNFKYSGAEYLWKDDVSYGLKGRSRLRLIGENGSGKSTLLNLITGFKKLQGESRGDLRLGDVSFGLLDQSFSILESDRSILENIQGVTQTPIGEIRNFLAQFLFRGDGVNQIVATLSGGEKMRAALAKILLQDPPPQLLILDEPTNNLDIGNIEFLEAAIKKFEGAMVIVCHDTRFVENLKVTDELKLS